MRCIDADALIHELNNSHYPGAPYVDAGISIAIGKICDAPTIEPERKGKWIEQNWTRNNTPTELCSVCGMWSLGRLENYCQNCGAQMER